MKAMVPNGINLLSNWNPQTMFWKQLVELSMKPSPNMPSHAIQLNSWISLMHMIREKLKMLRVRININTVLFPNLSRTNPTTGAATT
jgi:hypothetical protein